MEQGGTRVQSSGRHEVRLRVGEKHTIRLKGLGSAGYQWNLSLQGPGDLLRWTLEPVSESHGPAVSPGDLPPDNYSPDEELTITALKPGHVRMILNHSRAWERDRQPLEVICVDIQISA
jgi:predicted secreted protein